jgi:hypothetical protein
MHWTTLNSHDDPDYADAIEPLGVANTLSVSWRRHHAGTQSNDYDARSLLAQSQI